MANTDSIDVGAWVDDRLRTLEPAGTSQANLEVRLAEACRRRSASRARRVRWSGAAVVVGAIVASFPGGRAFAGRCLEACVNATAGVSQLWRHDEPAATMPRAIGSSVGDIAPDVVGTDEHGAPIRLSSRRGRMVVLNFWATWCLPCKAEIPLLNDLHARFGASGDIIGVSVDEDGWAAISLFVATQEVSYAIGLADPATTSAFGGVENLPATFVIDRDGRIVVKRVGVLTEGSGYQQIADLLAR